MRIVHLQPGDEKYLIDAGIEVKVLRHPQMENTLTVAHISDVDELCKRIVKLARVVDMVRKLNKNHA